MDQDLSQKLTCRQAYHQLELAPANRFITTFTTHEGLFQFKRLNNGMWYNGIMVWYE